MSVQDSLTTYSDRTLTEAIKSLKRTVPETYPERQWARQRLRLLEAEVRRRQAEDAEGLRGTSSG